MTAKKKISKSKTIFKKRKAKKNVLAKDDGNCGFSKNSIFGHVTSRDEKVF